MSGAENNTSLVKGLEDKVSPGAEIDTNIVKELEDNVSLEQRLTPVLSKH